MTDQERFARRKEQILRENEEQYGKECRRLYGEQVMADCASYAAGMTEEQWMEKDELEKRYLSHLARAMEEGDTAGESAREACRSHAAWLEKCWGKPCTPQAHMGMGEMYVQDPRFATYYESVSPGCAAFFAQAIRKFYGAEQGTI